MMFADLIDQDDFREALQSLGFTLPAGISPHDACSCVTQGLNAENAEALRQLTGQLLGSNASVQPSVRAAIDQVLLPALARV